MILGRTIKLLTALFAFTALLASCCVCCPSGRHVEPPDIVPTARPPVVVTATPLPLPPTPTPWVSGGAIELDETVEGQLRSNRTVDIWTLELAEPTIVTIDLIAVDDDFDPFLEVWSTDGGQIAFDDDGGDGFNSRLQWLELDAGSYQVHASAYSGNGDYTLSVRESALPAAETIEYGQTVEGEITLDMPQQWWDFRGQAGDMVDISMIGYGNLNDTFLELYSPDGEWLIADDDSGAELFALISGYMLPESGTYRIVARAFGEDVGPYDLTLEQFDIAEQTIAFGQTVEGEIDEEYAQQFWFFEGQAGETVNVAMTGRDDFQDTFLELYDSSNILLIQDDDSGGNLAALITAFTLPANDTYRIVARAYSTSVGEYELTLTRIKERPIAYGQTLTGELSAAEPQQRWLFEGQQGDVVNVSMAGLGSLQDTYLEIRDLDGTLLAQDDDGGKGEMALVAGFTLPYSGTYCISAMHTPSPYGVYEVEYPYGGPPTPTGHPYGSYRLALLQVEVGTLTYGQTVDGELSDEQPQGYWRFAGQPGEAVSVEALNQGSLVDTYVELYAPDGTLLAEDDDGGEGLSALIGEQMLYQAGNYRIVVRSYGEQLGAYRLALRRLPLATQVITYGQTLSGELTATQMRNYWRFDGQSGEQVTIAMNGLAGLDAYLELIGPDGARLALDDDSGGDGAALIADQELPTSGSYWIVAQGWGGALGSYELSLAE